MAYFSEAITVDTSSVAWTATTGANYQTIDTVISVPTKNEIYTVTVLFDGMAQNSYTRMLQIYDELSFTSLTIPTVAISKEDNAVVATIVGKNFTAPDVDLSNFTAMCTSKASIVSVTSFSISTDNVLLATFTIPGTASGKYQWTWSSATTGYNTKFTDIICTPSSTGRGAASSCTFTGGTDGSDNWDIICSVDLDGTAETAKNYPVFNYVNTYATNFDLTGDYAIGWYLPSLAELCYLYRNLTVVNSVLSALGGTEIASTYYWSSSQISSYHENAWSLYFSTGKIQRYLKNEKSCVCCVRAFN